MSRDPLEIARALDPRIAEALTQVEELNVDHDLATIIVNRLGSLWAREGNPFDAGLSVLDSPPEGRSPESVNIARCAEHGLHGQRDECFVCGGPVEQVEMVPAGDRGGAG